MAEENLPPEPSDEELEDMLEEDTPESPPENTGEPLPEPEALERPVNQPPPEPEAPNEERPTIHFSPPMAPKAASKGPGLSIPGSERTVFKTPNIPLEDVEARPPKSLAEEMPDTEDLLSLPEGSMGDGAASEEEVGVQGPSPDDLVHSRAASRRSARHARMGIYDAGPATFPENMEPPSIEGGVGGAASPSGGGGGDNQLAEAMKQLQTNAEKMVDVLGRIEEKLTSIQEGITKLAEESGPAYV